MIGKSVRLILPKISDGPLNDYLRTDEKKVDNKDEEKIVGALIILHLFYATVNFVPVLIALDDSDIQILKTYVCRSIPPSWRTGRALI